MRSNLLNERSIYPYTHIQYTHMCKRLGHEQNSYQNFLLKNGHSTTTLSELGVDAGVRSGPHSTTMYLIIKLSSSYSERQTCVPGSYQEQHNRAGLLMTAKESST